MDVYYLDKDGIAIRVPKGKEIDYAMDMENKWQIETRVNHVRVSTVFLAIDHRHGNDGPPILFETMVFGGEHDEYQMRYSNMAEAKIGHAKAVTMVKKIAVWDKIGGTPINLN